MWRIPIISEGYFTLFIIINIIVIFIIKLMVFS